jgi:hypothetical protein
VWNLHTVVVFLLLLLPQQSTTTPVNTFLDPVVMILNSREFRIKKCRSTAEVSGTTTASSNSSTKQSTVHGRRVVTPGAPGRDSRGTERHSSADGRGLEGDDRGTPGRWPGEAGRMAGEAGRMDCRGGVAMVTMLGG